MKQIKKKFADKRFFINGAYRNATSLTQEEILERDCQLRGVGQKTAENKAAVISRLAKAQWQEK